MQQKHQKVSPTGKGENTMRNAFIKHSTKHEAKRHKPEAIDIFPDHIRKG